MMFRMELTLRGRQPLGTEARKSTLTSAAGQHTILRKKVMDCATGNSVPELEIAGIERFFPTARIFL